MKLAAIDLGSNTLKYTLAETDPQGSLQVLAQDAQITRIGQDLDKNGYLLDEAMERTFTVLKSMVESARAQGAEKLACVATAGMRGAKNAQQFLDRARDELQLDVEIIHGLREAELSFKAPSAAYGEGALLVFDVGGRSTEIIFGSREGIESRVSLEMGGVRLTERFLPTDPPQPEDLDALFEHVRGVLSAAPQAPAGTRMVGVSGTILSLMGVQLDLQDLGEAVEQGEGKALKLSEVQRIFDELKQCTSAQRIRGSVIPEGRADVIVAGTAITLAVMAHYGLDEMIVSNRGVRFGLLFEMAQS